MLNRFIENDNNEAYMSILNRQQKKYFFNTELESGNQSIITRDHTDIENTPTRFNFEYLIYKPWQGL